MDAMRPNFVERPVDRAIARLAGVQHGVVSTRQLAELGVSPRAVSHRCAAGRLHRIHHGVYAVGHPVVSRHGRWLAAVLACGPDAALSHASAAALWELRATAATRIDVSVPGAGGRSRPGLRIHRRPALQTTTKDGIPVTTVAWTLFDLAATMPRRALERAMDGAEVQHLLDLSALDASYEPSRDAPEQQGCEQRSPSHRPLRGPSSRSACSPSAVTTTCRRRRSTATSRASKSTSTSSASGSSSRPTAGATTARAGRSSAIASGTRTWLE
jgi:hypothetical protein